MRGGGRGGGALAPLSLLSGLVLCLEQHAHLVQPSHDAVADMVTVQRRPPRALAPTETHPPFLPSETPRPHGRRPFHPSLPPSTPVSCSPIRRGRERASAPPTPAWPRRSRPRPRPRRQACASACRGPAGPSRSGCTRTAESVERREARGERERGRGDAHETLREHALQPADLREEKGVGWSVPAGRKTAWCTSSSMPQRRRGEGKRERSAL